MKKQNVRTLSLIVCTFTYLLVGAAIFDALESENENEERRYVRDKIETFKTKHNVTQKQFDDLSRVILLYTPHKAGHQWKFAGAFYFATTVITTIGYGHSAPRTSPGKVFCIFYALAGIPLTLVMFQSVGERLNTFVTFLLRNFKKCFKFRNLEVTQMNLILVALNLSAMVVIGGTYIFAHYEQWSYLNSFYYCFITLTTVGFGDYVALQKNQSLDVRPGYVAFGLAFIWFGLTVLAAAMNLMVLRLLTLNTEDERRDEIEAAKRARQAVLLDGDIITAGNGNAIFPAEDSDAIAREDDLLSVCSCTCYNFNFCRPPFKTANAAANSKNRYTATRPPTRVSHLLNVNEAGYGARTSISHPLMLDNNLKPDQPQREETPSHAAVYSSKRLSL